jgi:hypothetical protein
MRNVGGEIRDASKFRRLCDGEVGRPRVSFFRHVGQPFN